jgi:hypothetical protein
MCSCQPGFSGDICNLILTREPSCDNGGFCTPSASYTGASSSLIYNSFSSYSVFSSI